MCVQRPEPIQRNPLNETREPFALCEHGRPFNVWSETPAMVCDDCNEEIGSVQAEERVGKEA